MQLRGDMNLKKLALDDAFGVIYKQVTTALLFLFKAWPGM
jgi:hypothetical protein